MRVAPPIDLTSEQQEALEQCARTRSLLAALNTLDGKVIGLCQERHRHQEWIYFLRLVNDATPEHKQLHLIMDNYATHKHPAVQRWLKRHPRFHIHFTPTSASCH